jgi:hypothetical protein
MTFLGVVIPLQVIVGSLIFSENPSHPGSSPGNFGIVL